LSKYELFRYTMIFIWGHAFNCWDCFAIYILAVFDPSFLGSCEKSGFYSIGISLNQILGLYYFLIPEIDT
jgi:hypothetical protein